MSDNDLRSPVEAGAPGSEQEQRHQEKTMKGQLESRASRDATGACADCGARVCVRCGRGDRSLILNGTVAGWACHPECPPRSSVAGAPEEATRRVQQEDPMGCAVACLATVSGRTYAEVRADMNPAQVEVGLADQTVVWWLNRQRIWHRRFWLDGEWGYPVPTSGIAIMLTHDAHWVVLVDGVVLDPARAEPLPSYDFRQAIEVRPERAPVLAVDFSRSTTQDVDVEALTSRLSQLEATVAETRGAVSEYDYLRRECPDEAERDAGWRFVLAAMGMATPERPEADAVDFSRSTTSQSVAGEALTPPPSGSVAP